MGNVCVVIPDVHGRVFWRQAVAGRETEKIVFLGDYLDPYPWEVDQIEDPTWTLRQVIAFKKEHPDNVVLLLGNHDLGYVDRRICECRMDYLNIETNKRLILDNIALFDIVHCMEVEGKKFLFSHAGIQQGWVMHNSNVFGSQPFDPMILNTMFHSDTERRKLMDVLLQCSFFRGGPDLYSSPIWADVDELNQNDDMLPGYYQIFGHTLNLDGPVLASEAAICLDCEKAFVMDSDFNFFEL